MIRARCTGADDRKHHAGSRPAPRAALVGADLDRAAVLGARFVAVRGAGLATLVGAADVLPVRRGARSLAGRCLSLHAALTRLSTRWGCAFYGIGHAVAAWVAAAAGAVLLDRAVAETVRRHAAAPARADDLESARSR